MLEVCASPQALLRALDGIAGQEELKRLAVVALLAGGHLLIEGPPGVAKTSLCTSLAAAVDCRFARVQFTSDLMPSDITGMRVFDPRTASFDVVRGPIFANVVLADELNRAPAKVQSALLEAMQERRLTIGEQTFALPEPFMVLATINPIDDEGTYPLPHAQLDRFMLKARVSYPSLRDELRMLSFDGALLLGAPVASAAQVRALQNRARDVYVDPRIERYIVELVAATRRPHPNVRAGASPRASLALARAARVAALIDERDFVLIDDVQDLAVAALAHRIAFDIPFGEESMDGVQFVRDILARVAAP